MRPMLNENAIVLQLAATVPQLADLLRTHVEEFDEIIPHVFLGRVSNLVEELDDQRRANPAADALLAAIMSAFEPCFELADDDARNLISVSLIENVMQRAIDSPEFRSRLGPRLRADLEDMLRHHGL